MQAPVPWNSRLFSSCDEPESVREGAEPVTKAGFAPPGDDGRTFYQLLVKIANRVPASHARRRGHNPFNDAVLGRHLRGARRHPDNVVKTTNSGSPTSWSQTIEVEGVVWLGGRDLNPDNVVQRAVKVFRYALVRSVLLRFSPPTLRFALVRSGLFLCEMSHGVSGRRG